MDDIINARPFLFLKSKHLLFKIKKKKKSQEMIPSKVDWTLEEKKKVD